jgi:hypothetical protein
MVVIQATQVLLAQSAEEKKVADAVEVLRKALISAEQPTLDRITAPELSYGHSSGRVEDKAAFIEALTTGRSDFVTIELKDQTIQIVGSTAIVRHKLTAETFNDGVTGNVSISVLLIWQKQKGEWKLLVRQAFKI